MLDCNVGGEAFHVVADLAGMPPREIVRRLPEPALSLEPARPRLDGGMRDGGPDAGL